MSSKEFKTITTTDSEFIVQLQIKVSQLESTVAKLTAAVESLSNHIAVLLRQRAKKSLSMLIYSKQWEGWLTRCILSMPDLLLEVTMSPVEAPSMPFHSTLPCPIDEALPL